MRPTTPPEEREIGRTLTDLGCEPSPAMLGTLSQTLPVCILSFWPQQSLEWGPGSEKLIGFSTVELVYCSIQLVSQGSSVECS